MNNQQPQIPSLNPEQVRVGYKTEMSHLKRQQWTKTRTYSQTKMNNQQPQKVPINEIIPMLVAISDRHWEQFKALEKSFVDKYDVQAWQDVFNFQISPTLDRMSRRWIFQKKDEGETTKENILELTQSWIEETQGLRLVQATEGEGKPVTAEEILSIAQSCEWALIDDISDTPYAKSGYLHPLSLELGSGNRDEAYTRSGDAKVMFFSAYYE